MHQLRILCLFGWVICLLACSETQKANNQIYKGSKSELSGIDMIYSDSARAIVRMVTESQITSPVEDRIYPKEMKLWFYDKLGNVTSIIRGDSAHYFRQTNSYRLMGHVVINNQLKGELINTDEFTWLPGEKRIFTEKPVSIKTRTDIIHGIGLDAAQDFSTYSLRHVTNSILTVDELPAN
jgi:LPS export ABC transporter protein LptC